MPRKNTAMPTSAMLKWAAGLLLSGPRLRNAPMPTAAVSEPYPHSLGRRTFFQPTGGTQPVVIAAIPITAAPVTATTASAVVAIAIHSIPIILPSAP
ncbi:hypothetical protein ACFVAF_01700 [Streptomyces sp. NPDC057596]|uniref:hypothetical protein n=1 Tax=Streptomyces sp. NPDC057596 TaxID=3346178 RepID=UPI00369919B9